MKILISKKNKDTNSLERVSTHLMNVDELKELHRTNPHLALKIFRKKMKNQIDRMKFELET